MSPADGPPLLCGAEPLPLRWQNLSCHAECHTVLEHCYICRPAIDRREVDHIHLVVPHVKVADTWHVASWVIDGTWVKGIIFLSVRLIFTCFRFNTNRFSCGCGVSRPGVGGLRRDSDEERERRKQKAEQTITFGYAAANL